jgi:hypothetical protein
MDSEIQSRFWLIEIRKPQRTRRRPERTVERIILFALCAFSAFSAVNFLYFIQSKFALEAIHE